MHSAFGVEHGEVSKILGRHYHASQAALERGSKVLSARAQKLGTAHPKGEKWRNDRVWTVKRKRDARKWGGAGSKTYRVKPSKDVTRQKPNDYDRKKFESFRTSRSGLLPGTATRRQKKAKGQHHSTEATVTKVPGERGPTPKKIILGTGGVAGGAGGAVALERKRRSS